MLRDKGNISSADHQPIGLLKLHVSEGWCPSGGSIRWAHSMERLWFEVFDPNVSKTKTWLSARQPLTAKLSCLATALEGDPRSALPAPSTG